VLPISVIVPVFDTPSKLLRAAVCSVLTNPLAQQVQLILIDDASTDSATRHVLSELQQDPRVVLLHNRQNIGPASSRNRGLEAATRRWVGFLDADDIWLPGQFAFWQAMLAQQPEARWLATRHSSLTPNGIHIAAPRLEGGKPMGADLRQWGGPELTRALLGNFWLHLGTMLVQRELAQQAGGFADGHYYGEDIHFMTRISILAPLLLTENVGYGWRREGVSLTTSPRRLKPESLRIYKFAARDPALNGFRKEIRWAHYSATKGLALNNLLGGRRWQAMACALASWRMDPREWREFGLFMGLMLRQRVVDAQEMDRLSLRYSRAERFVGKSAAPLGGQL